MMTCFLLLLLVVPACASPFPVVIRGTVLDLNEKNQTLLLRADCGDAWCQVNVTGTYIGQVPAPEVFLRLKKGDMVEAVFNAWYMDLHDPSTGYVNPSDKIRDIRSWRAIQKLVYEGNTSDLKGTDAFGDTAYFAAPLAGGYAVRYDVRGPPPKEYDFRITPEGTVADITLQRGTDMVGTWSLRAGESFSYTDPSDHSSVSVTFVGGYRPDTYALESCPCTNLAVRVRPGGAPGAQDIPAAASPATAKGAALPALGVFATTGALVIRRLVAGPR
jgi:hypothetical protein